jgi:hypothetical protein
MWMDIGIVALLLFGVYAFAQLAGWETKALTRRTTRRAEDMYGQFADPLRKQRRYAREHGGEWRDVPANDPSNGLSGPSVPPGHGRREDDRADAAPGVSRDSPS